MTVDTAPVLDEKKSKNPVVSRDRREIIQQVREITGCDENLINQTIEACKDSNGHFSLEQVVNILVDDQYKQNVPRSKSSERRINPQNAKSLSPTTNETLNDDVAENQSSADDDLERAIQLSRESAEQMIDESDIAERKYFGEPVGLKNVGNTCWFNSIIQTLYALTDFRRLILDFRFVSSSRPLTEKEQQLIYFIQELRYLFILMLKSPRRSINPDRAIRKFKNTQKLSSADFSYEDCSEFTTHLIDLLENAYEIVTKSSENPALNPIQSFVTGEVLVERSEGKSIREGLRQIQIQMIDSKNLYDGLEELWLGSADEILKINEPIGEKRWLTRLPPVLFICLNRYGFSKTTKQTSKISSSFEFYPEIYLDRFMLENKETILAKRNLARSLYEELHELENLLNSYLKYPCNNESFALANAIRVVYEYATGCRLNPTLSRRNDSSNTEPTSSNRTRTPSNVSLKPSNITDDELQFIQNTLPIWLTEIEGKCAHLREELKRVENELKQLYEVESLRQVRYNLHAVCVHEGSATVGHFWTYVYHDDRQKWFRYNDNEVSESQWSDVFKAGVGGEPTLPSAYLLVYVNAKQKHLPNDFQIEMTSDVQRILDDDFRLWKEQIEKFRLEKMCRELKKISENLERTPNADQALTLPFFSGNNPPSDLELVKVFGDSMIKTLKSFENNLSSTDARRLLNEIVDREIRNQLSLSIGVHENLLKVDPRMKNPLIYFAVNQADPILLQRLLLDIIRLLPVRNEEIRLKILKYQARISASQIVLTGQKLSEYEKLLADYKDYRSVVASFLSGCQYLREENFEEAIVSLCVGSEYNLRITRQCSFPMRGMDVELLFRTRRLCFKLWNELVLNRFKTDMNYRLESMTHRFIPCLMQLKLSTMEDQSFIGEIQKSWCLLLDKIESSERSRSLEDFLQRLLEQPIDQHFHSISINKNQLDERYEETLRDLFRRFPSEFIVRQNDQREANRNFRVTTSIPIVVHRTNFVSPSIKKTEFDPNRNTPPS